MYIPHFVHSPFYCYAYSFGQLLVLALYQMYKQQGQAFVPGYLELLASGGSDSPDRLLSRLNVDVRDGAFWGRGLSLTEEMVARAEALAEAVGAAQ
jgi:oligoendopeptidase F